MGVGNEEITSKCNCLNKEEAGTAGLASGLEGTRWKWWQKTSFTLY